MANHEIGTAKFLKYIEEHANEDATEDIVAGYGYENIKEAVDRLTPEVKNGRMKDKVEGHMSFYDHYHEAWLHKDAPKTVGNDTIGIGDDMPELDLKDMDGNSFSFKSLRGKYVILDFWGSWCRFCIEEFPEMKKYYKKHKDRLEIVGIDCNDKVERWKEAVKKYETPWLHVRSADGIVEAKFQVSGYPFKVIISPEGKVLKTERGASHEDFFQYLDNLLK